jgi:hypothetical protein
MTANPAVLYEQFEPSMFCLELKALNDLAGIPVPEASAAETGNLKLLDRHTLNLGAKLHIWCDNPEIETEEEIAAAIGNALRALAQKNWGSPKLVDDYQRFQTISNTIGRAPGYQVADVQP